MFFKNLYPGKMKQKCAIMLWQKLLLLLTVMTVSSFSEHSARNAYYITPTPNTPCPGDPCLTLSQYAKQYYWNNCSSNTTLVFLPGDHTLNVTISMATVSNYTAQLNRISMKYFYYPHPSLTLLGSPSSLPEVTSRIVCSWPAGFVFSGITELHISSLAFISCGHNDSAAVKILSVQNMNISNCTFQNNTNSLNLLNDNDKQGGAIYVYNSTLTLKGNTFQNNFAQVGGALYSYTNNTLTLSENTFQNNSANRSGGTLLVHTYNMLTLSKNTFYSNSADYAGGTLYAFTNNILILSVNTFQNNSAHIGGAILAHTNNTLTLSDNTFQNNSANHTGGALLAHANNTLTLSENIFHSNSADHAGGGLYTFTNNILTLSVNTFQNNSANDGGAILAHTNNTFTFSDNTFHSNSADEGGALYVKINNTHILLRNIFRKNFADNAGGGLYTFTNNILTLSVNTFQNNSANVGGAILAHTNNTLTLSENTFQNNSANHTGGALLAHANNTLTLSENTFHSNSADHAGGGLYTFTNNILTLSVNTFHNNSANVGGAILAHTNNTFTFSDNTFHSNSADQGGALYAKTNNSLTLSGNKFQNNSADFGGSLFVNTSNTLTLSKNTFQNNFADNGGGTLIAYTNNTLTFLENTFQNNFADIGGVVYAKTNNTLTLSGNTFQNNSATYSGGALLAHTDNILTLSDNTFHSNSADRVGGALYAFTNNILTLAVNTFQYNSANKGGALYININNILNLSQNTFTDNSAGFGGGALLVSQSTINLISNNLTKNIAHLYGGAIFCFRNSTLGVLGSQKLIDNIASYGGGIAALECQIILTGDLLLANNSANFGGGLYVDQSHVSGHANFTNNFANADGGGIYSSGSRLHFKQHSTFISNYALNGGGLLFTESSQLHFQPNTTINFTNNFVEKKGGAVKVEKSNPLSYCANASCEFLRENQCFFQIETQRQYGIETHFSEITEIHNVRMYFQNNTALEAGADLYGGSVDHCGLNFMNQSLPSNHFIIAYRCTNSGKVFNYITRSDKKSLDISSDPLYICTCEDGEPDCSVSSITRSVYPGGRIEVPVIAYGQRNGTTPTVIHITPESKIEVDEPENTQSIKNTCTLLSYTVRTGAVGTAQEMTLYVEDPCPMKERTVSSLPTNTIKVYIHIRKCPPGFELLQFQTVCSCAQRLQRLTNTCHVDDGKIERRSEFWVGYVPNSTSNGLILHPHCPFDYCTLNKMYIAVDDSDEQCSNNRTGLLCGKCGEKFSILLGTNRCRQCSSAYLLLIIAFAFAGILLVLLLLALRLTVAAGTINGLVFYANIFTVNSTTFFRPQNTNVLTVFIAWLNLDLGIETCFYNGMDAYTKAWLQFVFPVYVWTLVGIIIFVSHYSSKVATILGSNPIAVLATLFLLSYTKFLRTIITSLSYTILEYPNNSQIAVWLYDGNIRYLTNKHIPLFSVALVCLIALFLPYTLFLIFSQWLRSKSGQWKVFHWVNNHRVLPFLDAYHAPYTDKHRYWTGLMLLVRCILFLLFAFNALGDPSVNLLAIGSVTAVLPIVYALFGNKIYKTWYLSMLELSFIANLCILALATLYIRSTEGNQNAVTFTSISIAFATFIGIVTYHSAQQIKHAPRLWQKVISRRNTYELVPQTDEDSDLHGTSPPSPPDPTDGCATVTHISLRELLDLNDDTELREPCLEMDD